MNVIAEHLDHDWVKTGTCVYCDPCGVRLYQGDVCTGEEKAAMAALFDAAAKASTVDPPGTNGQPCGAGHICCDDPSSPPLHDHLLSPDQCVRCVQRGAP